MSTNAIVGAGLGDRLRRGDEGVRDRDDDVAFAYAGGHQGETDGVGAAGDADAMLRLAEGGEFLFEAVYFGAADEVGGSDCLRTASMSSSSSSM